MTHARCRHKWLYVLLTLHFWCITLKQKLKLQRLAQKSSHDGIKLKFNPPDDRHVHRRSQPGNVGCTSWLGNFTCRANLCLHTLGSLMSLCWMCVCACVCVLVYSYMCVYAWICASMLIKPTDIVVSLLCWFRPKAKCTNILPDLLSLSIYIFPSVSFFSRRRYLSASVSPSLLSSYTCIWYLFCHPMWN